jgi:hypothetical protein
MFFRAPSRHGQSGQAQVESALSLPLTLFIMLGTLQLFLMLQGRIMAEYAAFRSVRAGSVKHGDCKAMTHAAVLALLPSFHSFMGGAGATPGDKLARAFGAYKDNQYRRGGAAGVTKGMPSEGNVVWIIRDSPLRGTVPNPEDKDFDQADSPNRRLEIRLIYWYPLNIPFANWVMGRMMLARWGWKDYSATNPLMATEKANWTQQSTPNLEASIRAEVMRRASLSPPSYTIPINASGSLRMMTPVRSTFFQTQNCPPAPEAL